MSVVRSMTERASGADLRRWVPLVLRATVVAMVLPAGLIKLVRYDARLAVFAELGVPVPELIVLIVGVVELLTAVAILLGVASRLAALVLVPVMVTAMWFAGVGPTNLVVLLASGGIVVLGPGRYAVWEPASGLLERIV